MRRAMGENGSDACDDLYVDVELRSVFGLHITDPTSDAAIIPSLVRVLVCLAVYGAVAMGQQRSTAALGDFCLVQHCRAEQVEEGGDAKLEVPVQRLIQNGVQTAHETLPRRSLVQHQHARLHRKHHLPVILHPSLQSPTARLPAASRFAVPTLLLLQRLQKHIHHPAEKQFIGCTIIQTCSHSHGNSTRCWSFWKGFWRLSIPLILFISSNRKK